MPEPNELQDVARERTLRELDVELHESFVRAPGAAAVCAAAEGWSEWRAV